MSHLMDASSSSSQPIPQATETVPYVGLRNGADADGNGNNVCYANSAIQLFVRAAIIVEIVKFLWVFMVLNYKTLF